MTAESPAAEPEPRAAEPVSAPPAPAAAADPPAAPDSLGPRLRAAASLLGAVTSQLTLVTAILYYAGRSYAQAKFAYFGIDVAMLNYSTADYLLGSLAEYWPATIAVLLALGLIGLRRGATLMQTQLPRVQRLRAWLAEVALAAGSTLIVTLLAVLAVANVAARSLLTPALNIVAPVALIVAIALVAYGLTARAAFSPNTALVRSPSPWTLAGLLILGLLGCLWAVGAYANHAGNQAAATAEQEQFAHYPWVVVYSTDPLFINVDGAIGQTNPPPASKFKYQYSGLRLLAHTPDRYFLVPQHWQRTHVPVFVVNANDSIRIDILITS